MRFFNHKQKVIFYLKNGTTITKHCNNEDWDYICDVFIENTGNEVCLDALTIRLSEIIALDCVW